MGLRLAGIKPVTGFWARSFETNRLGPDSLLGLCSGGRGTHTSLESSCVVDTVAIVPFSAP